MLLRMLCVQLAGQSFSSSCCFPTVRFWFGFPIPGSSELFAGLATSLMRSGWVGESLRGSLSLGKGPGSDLGAVFIPHAKGGPAQTACQGKVPVQNAAPVGESSTRKSLKEFSVLG